MAARWPTNPPHSTPRCPKRPPTSFIHSTMPGGPRPVPSDRTMLHSCEAAGSLSAIELVFDQRQLASGLPPFPPSPHWPPSKDRQLRSAIDRALARLPGFQTTPTSCEPSRSRRPPPCSEWTASSSRVEAPRGARGCPWWPAAAGRASVGAAVGASAHRTRICYVRIDECRRDGGGGIVSVSSRNSQRNRATRIDRPSPPPPTPCECLSGSLGR